MSCTLSKPEKELPELVDDISSEIGIVIPYEVNEAENQELNDVDKKS